VARVVGSSCREAWLVPLEPGPQRVEGLPPLSLPIMAAHYPSVPARWSDRRERHPAWDLVSRCDFILVGSAVLLSLIGAVMVYSATRVELTAVGGDPKFYLKRPTCLAWHRPRRDGGGGTDRLSPARAMGLCDLWPRRHGAPRSAHSLGHVSLGAQRCLQLDPSRCNRRSSQPSR